MKFSGFPEGICFFHSASRGKHSYLATMDTRVCSDGLVYVRLTGPYESLGESQRSFCWLRSSLLFHGEPLVNPTDVSFFFFFGSAISPTLRLSNTNHSIGRAWHRTFPPTLWSSLGLFVTCMASFIRFIRMWRARDSEGKRFPGFRTTSLIYSSKLARNLENKRETFPRNFGKDGLFFFFFFL